MHVRWPILDTAKAVCVQRNSQECEVVSEAAAKCALDCRRPAVVRGPEGELSLRTECFITMISGKTVSSKPAPGNTQNTACLLSTIQKSRAELFTMPNKLSTHHNAPYTIKWT